MRTRSDFGAIVRNAATRRSLALAGFQHCRAVTGRSFRAASVSTVAR